MRLNFEEEFSDFFASTAAKLCEKKFSSDDIGKEDLKTFR